MYTQKDSSQDLTTVRLNTLISKRKSTIKVSRSCYTSREKTIKLELYEKLYNLLDEHIAANYQKNTLQIFLL